MIAQNKLSNLLEDRARAYMHFLEKQTLYNQYKHNGSVPTSVLRSLMEKIHRVRALNHRIAQLGQRYSIIEVRGKVLIDTGSILVAKSFKILYTDISEYDATRKVQILYGEDRVSQIKTRIIECGKNIDDSFFKA